MGCCGSCILYFGVLLFAYSDHVSLHFMPSDDALLPTLQAPEADAEEGEPQHSQNLKREYGRLASFHCFGWRLLLVCWPVRTRGALSDHQALLEDGGTALHSSTHATSVSMNLSCLILFAGQLPRKHSNQERHWASSSATTSSPLLRALPKPLLCGAQSRKLPERCKMLQRTLEGSRIPNT